MDLIASNKQNLLIFRIIIIQNQQIRIQVNSSLLEIISDNNKNIEFEYILAQIERIFMISSLHSSQVLLIL